MANNFYDILGVSKTANQDEIKKAFRKKAHKLHPDKDGGDEAKFKELNEAYQVLSNKEKRQQYDQFGSTYEDMRRNGGGAPGGGNPFGGFGGQQGQQAGAQYDFGDIGDIFSEFFGGGGRARRGGPARGRDIEIEMAIDFNEAVFGVQKDLGIDLNDTCETCSGSGAEPGTPIETCATCKGAGEVQQIRNSMLGQIRTSAVCPECKGEGKTSKTKCANCSGNGTEFMRKELKVDIPGGIQDGQTIRLTGQGEAGKHGGPKGDIYIRVSVRPSKVFEREGNNIHSRVEITFAQAALGDEVSVKTVDGEGALKIPSGTQSGSRIKIRGKGASVLNGSGRGDHIVTVQVKIPKKLSRKQRKLLEDLRELDDTSGFKGWF